jgi:hypothetical protein
MFYYLTLSYSLSIAGQIDWHTLHLREAIWSLRRRKANLSDPRVETCKKPFVGFLHQQILNRTVYWCTPICNEIWTLRCIRANHELYSIFQKNQILARSNIEVTHRQ